MKRAERFVLLFLIIGLFALTGCGRDGGNTQSPPPQPTTAVLKISTQGTLPPGTHIGDIDLTVTLPLGVIPDTDAVVASGVAAINSAVSATFSPISCSSTLSGPLVMHIANASGFGTGEFVTVNTIILNGIYPQASDFTWSTFNPRDINGALITGLTVTFTADIGNFNSFVSKEQANYVAALRAAHCSGMAD